MKAKRIIAVCAGIAVALVSARMVYSFSRFREVGERFDRVHEGQTWNDVITLLGKPNYHEGTCLQDLSGSGCVSELVYSHPFAPCMPEYYVIDLSADNRVISASHLISP